MKIAILLVASFIYGYSDAPQAAEISPRLGAENTLSQCSTTVYSQKSGEKIGQVSECKTRAIQS